MTGRNDGTEVGSRGPLTGRASSHVDDVALRPLDVFALHLQHDGLHEDGVLGPGLQLLQAHVRVAAPVLGQIHVHHVPAVGAAAVLPVKLGDVLERTGEDKPKCRGEFITKHPLMSSFCWFPKLKKGNIRNV